MEYRNSVIVLVLINIFCVSRERYSPQRENVCERSDNMQHEKLKKCKKSIASYLSNWQATSGQFILGVCWAMIHTRICSAFSGLGFFLKMWKVWNILDRNVLCEQLEFLNCKFLDTHNIGTYYSYLTFFLCIHVYLGEKCI